GIILSRGPPGDRGAAGQGPARIGRKRPPMINLVWAGMILSGIIWASLDGEMEKVTSAMFRYAGEGLATSLNLLAIVTVWFGISRIAEKAGLLAAVARIMTPVLRPLLPGVP